MTESRPAGSPALLRRLNSAAVLHAVRANGPVSRADLARTTGLSKPTVNGAVELLLGHGLRRPRARTSRTTGHGRAGVPAFCGSRAGIGHVLGVDIGADKVLVLVADLERRGARGRAPQDRRAQATRPDALLALVADDGGERTGRRGGLAREREGRRCRHAGRRRPGLGRRHAGAPARRLGGNPARATGSSASFACPVLVDNEVRLSLLAERWRGAARGDRRCASSSRSASGSAAGCSLGGEVYRGAGGAAGEIGYLPLADDAEPSDGLGPFEHAAGGTAFARLARRAVEAAGGASSMLELAGGDPDAIDAETVFVAAAQGDAVATQVLEQLLDRLGARDRGRDRRARPVDRDHRRRGLPRRREPARPARGADPARSCRWRRGSCSRGSATRRSRSAACGSRCSRSSTRSSTSRRWSPPERVLAVGAHPDDLEILCGGTLARFVREGHDVVMCHAALGDRGSFVHTSEEIAAIRGEEARRAAELCGARHATLGLTRRRDERRRPASSGGSWSTSCARRRPDLIITHHPHDYMGDHNELSRLVFDCSFHATLPLYETGKPHHATVTPIYYMDTIMGLGFQPTEYVDVSAVIDTKAAMLEAHASQLTWLRDHDGIDIVEQMRTATRFRGLQCGAQYAEGFVPCLDVAARNDEAAPAVKG